MAGRKRTTEALLASGPERGPRRGFSVELAVGVARVGLDGAYGAEALHNTQGSSPTGDGLLRLGRGNAGWSSPCASAW